MMSRYISVRSMLCCLACAVATTAYADPEPWKGPPFTTEQRTHDRASFRVFHGGKIDFTMVRPQRSDARILLAVAGTYTSREDTAEGHIIDHGTVRGDSCIYSCRSWNAVAYFESGYVRIERNSGEELVRSGNIATMIQVKGSLIQGHLLVEHGVPIRGYARSRTFHRRALVTHRAGYDVPDIIESVQPFASLSDFAEHLAALGAHEAINLDMGAWDEGWYRDPATGTIHTLGQIRTATDRQTNWIIIRK
ncbi:hypothetical protein HY632_01140 [Candidatus Uhrbacteria bacterium]|nr:hypothetical protein [Candidatus Uhrbacteria bacterium]